jgi:hypothetical protein
MLIKFFRNGKGAGVGPVGYLVADKVLAYDDNRDLIRDADGQPMTVTREPLPEVLRGNPDRTEALIDASRHQWTYRAGVISFAATDAPTEDQQAEVMDGFERLAFAGLEARSLGPVITGTQRFGPRRRASYPNFVVQAWARIRRQN